jgi:hypothetical protein
MRLHQEWCSVGYDPDAFWRQTPASFASAMNGALARMRRNAEGDLAAAHATASFTRAKTIEPLEHYLPRRRRRAGSSAMLDRLKAIAAATEDME